MELKDNHIHIYRHLLEGLLVKYVLSRLKTTYKTRSVENGTTLAVVSCSGEGGGVMVVRKGTQVLDRGRHCALVLTRKRYWTECTFKHIVIPNDSCCIFPCGCCCQEVEVGGYVSILLHLQPGLATLDRPVPSCSPVIDNHWYQLHTFWLRPNKTKANHSHRKTHVYIVMLCLSIMLGDGSAKVSIQAMMDPSVVLTPCGSFLWYQHTNLCYNKKSVF